MVRIIPLTILCAVMLASCPSPNRSSSTDSEEASFYAQNTKTDAFYTVKANKLAEGSKCVIWAEKGSGVTEVMARNIANEYDTKIRPKVIQEFSKTNFSIKQNGITFNFTDMLHLANELAGRKSNGKLTILLLDIKDEFSPPDNMSFVAGYFWAGNLFSRSGQSGVPNSNERDMLYIDTNPGLSLEPQQTYATFAHELQHMVNFVTSYGKLINDNETDRVPALMDTWIDEGLSTQAEHFYLGKNEERIDWYSADKEGTIAKGNNFFVWGNHTDKPMAILDDYATTYLFFRWLYLQAGGNSSNVLMNIITSPYGDHQAVTNVAKNINTSWSSWEALLRTWLAANYHPANTTYGYKGDTYLQTHITTHYIDTSSTSTPLYPGEGVYSKTSSTVNLPSSLGNIHYGGFEVGGNIITSGTSTAVLITFNASTAKPGEGQSWPTESGTITGTRPSVLVAQPSIQASNGRSAASVGKPARPYVIDARDRLGKGLEFNPALWEPLKLEQLQDNE